MSMRNPVHIRTFGIVEAQALAAFVRRMNAPVSIYLQDVIVPGDHPGFLFAVVTHALESGYASDEDCSDAVRQMENGLARRLRDDRCEG